LPTSTAFHGSSCVFKTNGFSAFREGSAPRPPPTGSCDVLTVPRWPTVDSRPHHLGVADFVTPNHRYTDDQLMLSGPCDSRRAVQLIDEAVLRRRDVERRPRGRRSQMAMAGTTWHDDSLLNRVGYQTNHPRQMFCETPITERRTKFLDAR